MRLVFGAIIVGPERFGRGIVLIDAVNDFLQGKVGHGSTPELK
jgi:hypothetical protein